MSEGKGDLQICICIKKKSDDSRQESVGRIIKIVGIPPGELIAKTNTLIGFQSFERKNFFYLHKLEKQSVWPSWVYKGEQKRDMWKGEVARIFFM